MKVGQIETKSFKWYWRDCELCDRPASWRITFLDDGSNGCRRNPSSSAYGKDDCSWCSDYELFACKKHRADIERWEPKPNHNRCSSFPLKNFKHMGFYKKEIKV